MRYLLTLSPTANTLMKPHWVQPWRCSITWVLIWMYWDRPCCKVAWSVLHIISIERILTCNCLSLVRLMQRVVLENTVKLHTCPSTLQVITMKTIGMKKLRRMICIVWKVWQLQFLHWRVLVMWLWKLLSRVMILICVQVSKCWVNLLLFQAQCWRALIFVSKYISWISI